MVHLKAVKYPHIKMFIILCSFLILGFSMSLSDAQAFLKAANPELQQYDEYNNDMLPTLSRDLTLISQAVESINDPICKDQCKLILSDFRNLSTWAVKFYDASSKFPEGILAGSIYQLGNFDECVEIGKKSGETPHGIHGQYCLGELHIQTPDSYLNKDGSVWAAFKPATRRSQDPIKKLFLGICVPAACKAQSVQNIIQRIIDVAMSGSKLKLIPSIQEKSCFRNEPVAVDTIDIVYLCIILPVFLIVITGSLYHLVYKPKEESSRTMFSEILYGFSIFVNWKKLSGPAHNDDLNLESITGIKFIAMGLIVSAHCLIFVVSGPILNKEFWEEALGKVENSVFVNNALLVDTFLFLSGFLFCRILLRELDKRKSINFIILYFYRYLRLTPAYMVMIGLYVTWLPKLASGPLWTRMILEKEKCLTSWWANLLYINNYVNTDNICMFQSWYLSVDTQLFILAPAVVYPLWKWRKAGEYILAGVTALSLFFPFIMTLTQDLDPSLLIYKAEVNQDISLNEYFKTSYIKTHMRASSYCFGLIFGYVIYRIQTLGTRLSKNTVIIGWLLGVSSLLASMCSISVFYGPRSEFTAIEAALYAAMHRALWNFGTGWVILACVTNNSGPVNNLLKWRPFVMFSRLTYSAYLTNGLIELHSASILRVPIYMSVYSLTSKVLSHIVLTFLSAVVLTIFFEAPILGVERIFLRKESKQMDLKKNNIEETTAEA